MRIERKSGLFGTIIKNFVSGRESVRDEWDSDIVAHAISWPTYKCSYMPLHRALINVWAYESIKGDPISFRFLLTGWTFTDSVARIAMNQCAVKLVSFFKLQAFLFKIIELSIYLFWRIDFVLLLFGNFPLCNWRIARNRRTIIWFTMYKIKS